MKTKLYCIILLACSAAVISCKKDNYNPPASTLSGHVVYKGEAIQLEYNQVPYEIYQFGFGKVGPIGQVFDQDGKYSSLLFDGDYRLTIPAGQGPFIWKQTAGGKSDSIAVTMKGNQTLDIEVTPYYMIRTPQITVAGGKASSTCKIEKIVTDANAKNIESVTLYVNKTQYVSPADNLVRYDSAIATTTDLNNLKLTVTVPAIVPTQSYIYARIGLKIAGVEDRIFSPVTKINL